MDVPFAYRHRPRHRPRHHSCHLHHRCLRWFRRRLGHRPLRPLRHVTMTTTTATAAAGALDGATRSTKRAITATKRIAWAAGFALTMYCRASGGAIGTTGSVTAVTPAAVGARMTARSKCPPWHCPSSRTSSGCAPGGTGQLGTPRVRPIPLESHPLPRVLELATPLKLPFPLRLIM